MSTTHETGSYDYVIVGGGTAGAVVAARLSEDPSVSVCLIEAGPSDIGNDSVLQLHNWLSVLEGPLDLAYTTTLQPRGNAHIVHSRACVLGGCSSHNTMIWFKPLPGDFGDWVNHGAAGWEADAMDTYYQRLLPKHQLVAEKDRNALLQDWVPSAAAAAGVPANPDWNAAPFKDGAGFDDVGYDPETGVRSSSAVSYLHPIMGKRANLTIMLETWVRRVNLEGGRAVSVSTDAGVIRGERQIILSAGAIDTPRLLMLSGIGAADDLRALGIEVQHNLPGVGENLIDHPESIILWEIVRPMPPGTTMDSDCVMFVNRLGLDERPDLMFHTYQIPFTFNTERLGYPVPENAMCMTPNIPRSRSVGRMWLLSSNPEIKPALDFRYFMDEDGYDAQTIVDGLKIARDVAATEPFKSWIKREIAPGPELKSDEELSRYGRAVHHTVYHPLGTCKMGAVDDETAVVDPTLRVRGIDGLTIADGSIFPSMITVNPMVCIYMIGEKAADLVRARS